MKDLFVADAHCDTAGEMYKPFRLYKNDTQLDLERMLDYKGWLQIFAVWTDPERGCEFIRRRFDEAADNFYNQIRENSESICAIKSGSELKAAQSRCIAVLGVEGGEIIGDDLSYIDYLYSRGVRMITLTWNYKNKIGGGADFPDEGLTEFGAEVIGKMNEKRIISDLSHSSEATFWDVCRLSERAFAVSHSNAKKLCNHRRNLSDEQIKEIIKRNGFIGINYYPPFLNESGNAKVSDIIRHIEYFMALGAENVLGLGSDFDGIDYPPEGIRGAEDVYKIAQELLRLNYSEEAVKNIMGENLYDFLLRELA